MNDDIEYLVCDVALLWRRILNTHSKQLGISNVERRLIINVDRNPGATQIVIAQLLEMEPQNLIRPLDKLVSEQLIEKRVNPNDRRSNFLFITPQGKNLVQKIQKINDAIRPLALNHLSAQKAEELKLSLQKIKESLEAHLTCK